MSTSVLAQPRTEEAASWRLIIGLLVLLSFLVWGYLLAPFAEWVMGYHSEAEIRLPRFQNPRRSRPDRVAPCEVIAVVAAFLAGGLLSFYGMMIVVVLAIAVLCWSAMERFGARSNNTGSTHRRDLTAPFWWGADKLTTLLVMVIDGIAGMADQLRPRR